jgi:hypothetical protein
MSFTFLFITKGREHFGKSLSNCLILTSKFNYVNIIIIDGNKDDRVKNYLTKNFPNTIVKVIKQTKGKFVRACLIGAANINTNFFTFMHDDDYISPSFIEMINFAIENNTSVIGNGVVLPKESSHFKFKNLNNFEKIKSNVLINKYYCSKKINQIYLPANPACSVFKTEILSIWKLTIKEILKNKFLASYLVYKNIGQDLLLYLIALSVQKKIYYSKEYSCQFSSHQESMSVNFGTHNLGVGYWLAKKFFSKFEGNIFNHKITFEEKFNLFFRGVIYCFKQAYSKNKFYFHSTIKLLKEIINNKKIEINYP